MLPMGGRRWADRLEKMLVIYSQKKGRGIIYTSTKVKNGRPVGQLRMRAVKNIDN